MTTKLKKTKGEMVCEGDAGGCGAARCEISAEFNPALRAGSCPLIAKYAKSGAPIFLVACEIKSESNPPKAKAASSTVLFAGSE